MPDCEYCGNSFGTDGALVDHLLECEDRSAWFKQSSDDNAEDWFDYRFSNIGVSKLMCLLCDTWYRSYNAFYNEGFHYLGCHDHVFKYYKLPVLLQFQPVVLQFQGCLTTLQWKRKLETDGDQQFFVYKLKIRGRTKQVRDRSPEPKRDPL